MSLGMDAAWPQRRSQGSLMATVTSLIALEWVAKQLGEDKELLSYRRILVMG